MNSVQNKLPTHIEQPGTVGAAYVTASTRVDEFEFVLPAGVSIADAVTQELAARHYAGAYLYFTKGRIAHAEYVIPDVTPDAEHVAWYSPMHKVSSASQFECAGINCGQGEPYYHCHASASDVTTQKTNVMGHFLLENSTFSQDVIITAMGYKDAFFNRIADQQTGFNLLSPEVVNQINAQQADAILLRIAPNVEVSQPIIELCQQYGWQKASIHGVGSLIGAHFADGRILNNFMTEFLITKGNVDLTKDSAQCQLEIVIVSEQDEIMQGLLAQDTNPVLITSEFIIRRLA
ncbi:MAG: DUF296 domain-containing protein [Alphaproteobacteria bacterium]|nr:DUF296 domain-containing protein [Alphaproteobacteria bacterium]